MYRFLYFTVHMSVHTWNTFIFLFGYPLTVMRQVRKIQKQPKDKTEFASSGCVRQSAKIFFHLLSLQRSGRCIRLGIQR